MSDAPLLIATDEAGYGPKLGPLVIAASVWRLPKAQPVPPSDRPPSDPSSTALEALFAPLTVPFPLGDGPPVQVGDSKRLFKSRDPQGLRGLENVVHAALQWAGVPPVDALTGLLEVLCAEDHASLGRQPWFGPTFLADAFPLSDALRPLSPAALDPLLQHWQQTGLELVAISSRVIDAATFNAACQAGRNKAEILSEATIRAVVQLLDRYPACETAIYCDRHGGRRYYGGLLQHASPAALLEIEQETATCSTYRQRQGNRHWRWQFTVKGDRFPPVSFSSILAKYLRERMMGCFNAYWRQQQPQGFRPTAGYPQDAKRFLKAVEGTRQRLQIDLDQLCRQR
jgi:ribonuclease HII